MKPSVRGFFLFAATLSLALPVWGAENAGASKEEALFPWIWANFILLVIALGWLAHKFVRPYFSSRSEQILKEIADGDERRKQADAKTAEIDARLANLDQEVAALRGDAKKQAEREAERLRTEGAAEIERVRVQAAQQVDSLTKNAMLDLRRHASNLALSLAEQKLRTGITPEIQTSLAQGFVDKLHA